jgi:alpha-L-fucosidase
VTFDPARWFRITNRTNGLTVDGGGATQQGAYPVQSVYTGATTQQWSLRDTGGNVVSGSPLKQWTEDGSPNLRWQFVVA